MEKVQNLKHCSWISEELDVQEFHQQHRESLRMLYQCHPSKVGWQEACRKFFNANATPNIDDDQLIAEGDMSAVTIEQLCDLNQMEKDCGIDLLTVPNELPASDTLDDANSIASKMPTNWFEGSFNDSTIPEGGPDKLLTLYHQAAELNKRTSVGDYATLRFRTLKYFTTVRLPQEINTAPLETNFPEDVILNVRIQRPYFKKTHFKKASNKFPAHSQELLLLGGQLLTELRDSIECVNDFAMHHDMSRDPHVDSINKYPRAKEEFPSGLFYINGTFYVDMRHKGAKDCSIGLQQWARKIPEIGELTTKHMEDTRLKDLKLRLGYPYLYLHQGYCEHLISFTDIRLREKTDVADPSCYPISRGHSTRLSVRCCTCNRNLAKWVVMNCSLLSNPQAHTCDTCLKLFCYDNEGRPKDQFVLYPFFDEGAVHLEKLKFKKRDDVGSGDGVGKSGVGQTLREGGQSRATSENKAQQVKEEEEDDEDGDFDELPDIEGL